ncbi:3 exoribonuclease family protein [Grosmannia clavigera kw1407]|uniref:3 exoribonuclease family protein n=1 Tax=Grosmannia clavigera (strain kw1407 / UAMH 11150) TaxID=655863 RepID=F0XEY7_GROCL|nr:3 exoribonuclease family protein [Grosmannia clavigera kw1407]EFX04203.1 3 exoribonuclease family protein [Grosmannia clavigera kw1407]
MTDRRRINGPVGATAPPVFARGDQRKGKVSVRTRPNDIIRKICECRRQRGREGRDEDEDRLLTARTDLQTGVTPSASGSAYLELSSGAVAGTSGLKLSCTVHGPRALPRSMPFSPHLILSTHVKYAPFATKERRGYLRDTSERDLAVHLETSLRGAILGERWPKSGVDIVVSVIEADQDRSAPEQDPAEELWGMMNVLSGCVTVASAALADAGIDCVDTVAGGVAALVEETAAEQASPTAEHVLVADPVPAEHGRILAACCVAYLPNRDEVTNLWLKGDMPPSVDGALQLQMIDQALHAARQADQVIVAALQETAEQ